VHLHLSKLLALQMLASYWLVRAYSETNTSLTMPAVDQYGSVFELHPDGNSLDMMSGMIRKKI
jgi:hypothetical protein